MDTMYTMLSYSHVLSIVITSAKPGTHSHYERSNSYGCLVGEGGILQAPSSITAFTPLSHRVINAFILYLLSNVISAKKKKKCPA